MLTDTHKLAVCNVCAVPGRVRCCIRCGAGVCHLDECDDARKRTCKEPPPKGGRNKKGQQRGPRGMAG